MLRIEILGGLTVRAGGQVLPLPASRKTRALLGYLILARQPQRREHLCSLLWDIPDDPKGALRWSLSKLRAALKPVSSTWLMADRERVWINTTEVVVDLFEHQASLESPGRLAIDDCRAAVTALRQPLLAGVELPNQREFQSWLTAVRDDAELTHRRLLMRLALESEGSPDEALPWCREWFECDPLNVRAVSALSGVLRRLGRGADAKAVVDQYTRAARDAGFEAQELASDSDVAEPRASPSVRTDADLLERQTIGFTSTSDGVRIALAAVGRGPPMVKAANWLNHLELDWYSPIWAPLFRELARDYRFIRYDERGNGLSDWQVADLSFDAFVRDLESVIDTTTSGPVPLLGISQGCAVAIEFAARHPERVSHLILWGGYAEGWRINATAEVRAEREAIFTLVRQGWGRTDPAYRHLFSATFMPSATPAELDWFNNFQRETVSPENAVRFLEIFADIDVRHRLHEVSAPTLVMHARGDQRVPLALGGAIAAGIPGAEFVTLESANHLLLGREPASGAFVAHIRQFLSNHSIA